MTDVYAPEVLNDTTAVQVLQPRSVVRADVQGLREAVSEYRRVQAELDALMPDCIMEIGRKLFRKKAYWRGVATAFNVSHELVSETYSESDGVGTWVVVYRGIAPNGRSTIGDGACSGDEKAAGQDTIHNVRGHAHTRAMNRATSNLVGFGEVSAEEMQRTEMPRPSRSVRTAPPPPFTRTVETPTGPRPEWFTQAVGFGKHKDKTWEHMSQGALDGDRFGYLKYLLSTPAKSDRDRDIQSRARYCLGIIEDKTEKQYAAAEAAPAEPNWDADVPLPEAP